MKLKSINIDERMQHYNVQGMSMALINQGEIRLAEFGVLENGTNRKVNEDSLFNACSISKFVTTMLVLKLVEQGILDLDEDVNNRLKSWKVPECPFTQIKRVTLRTLLSHQSGFMDPKGSFEVLDPTDSIPTMVDLLEGNTVYCPEPIKVKYEPESDFQYSDVGFCVIEQLLEDVLEKPFKMIMQEQIFEPLNMKSSTLDCLIPEDRKNYYSSGHNKEGKLVDRNFPIYPYSAAAGLWTTPKDLSILVNELIESLKGNGKLGISESKIKDMISPQGSFKWTGLGIFLDKSGQEIEISSLGWGIGFQCMMVAYPLLETAVIIMINTDVGVHQTSSIIGEIFKSVESQLLSIN
ncbi:serine hydrolase domain-containing protein [Psychrobacillus vulpis]|uniref:Beta-lactamase family protein n=1 Tax=Psychrobacillus vulpis TaxID=2325572 RepID=A0A544TW54_9BACI|nr:serine hydrolase domain-containing protein [Psychrobacillus vulpis]TQR21680.1 beta-lactamase family protein [Psychrobacillus vulpis]